jgi:hypothetical protein
MQKTMLLLLLLLLLPHPLTVALLTKARSCRRRA